LTEYVGPDNRKVHGPHCAEEHAALVAKVRREPKL
jgi:hypothetical protein